MAIVLGKYDNATAARDRPRPKGPPADSGLSVEAFRQADAWLQIFALMPKSAGGQRCCIVVQRHPSA